MFKLLHLARVAECSITECAYNSKHVCRAIAITVGRGKAPACETFLVAAEHAGQRGHAGVGACKASDCRFNQALQCTADSILVGKLDDCVRCLTHVPE